MKTKNVNAANIGKVEFENGALRLYFYSGQIVTYKNVPEGIFAGLCNATSVGSFLRLYVSKEYSYVVEKASDLKDRNQKLEHHKDTTLGLWATDRPDLIPDEVKDLFFEIKYDEREVVQNNQIEDKNCGNCKKRIGCTLSNPLTEDPVHDQCKYWEQW